MKFLHLSDLHLGKLLFEYNLLEDQEFWCRQLLELLRRDPHDAVIIAGDLYDRSVPPGEAVALMDRFLTALVAELKLPVLAIAGNHDSPQRLAFGAGLYRSSGLYLAAVPQREIQRVTLADQWGEADFWLLPYLTPADGKTLFPQQSPRTFQEAYQLIISQNLPRLTPGRRNVLVAHGFFCRLSAEHPVGQLETCESETTIGAADLVDAALFDPFHYCAFGHLHGSQRAGAERMRYCGSPLAYSVSEERQKKSVLSVELDGDGNWSAMIMSLSTSSPTAWNRTPPGVSAICIPITWGSAIFPPPSNRPPWGTDRRCGSWTCARPSPPFTNRPRGSRCQRTE